MIGALLGRAAAAVKALTEQAQPFGEALLGDLALEHQLLVRARYIKALAVALGNPAVENLADRLITAHSTAVDWLTTRAMNRIYEVDEGRPMWKLRPQQLLLTLVALVITAAVAFVLVVSGPLASAIDDALGVGPAALTVWNIAPWPIVLVLVSAG